MYEIRSILWVQDKKTVFGFEIRPLFRYDIRKILFGYEKNYLGMK